MQDILKMMFEKQMEFVKSWVPLDTLDVPQREHYSLKYLQCIMEEIIELQREYPSRKFWHKIVKGQVDDKKALLEFIDVLLFLVALAVINGWTPEKIQDAYLEKTEFNKKRFL